jgi:cytidine deaminase
MNYDQLIKEALKAKEMAYAPYSNFRVGAALLSHDGNVYRGTNIENASYGLTNCAERTALFSALTAGAGNFKAIAIVTDKQELIPPCGACRQVLAEHCPGDLDVILANESGESKIHKLNELLPLAFDNRMLT